MNKIRRSSETKIGTEKEKGFFMLRRRERKVSCLVFPLRLTSSVPSIPIFMYGVSQTHSSALTYDFISVLMMIMIIIKTFLFRRIRKKPTKTRRITETENDLCRNLPIHFFLSSYEFIPSDSSSTFRKLIK